jgi:hypothetical protein
VIGDWGEVVTRYPYRKVGMDHLLSRSSLELRARALQVEPAGLVHTIRGPLLPSLQGRSPSGRAA